MTQAARTPRRAHFLVPPSLPRRRELLAGCALVAVVAHLLFAQLTLLIAVVCYLIGRATRWRTAWLLGPALAGLAWALAAGLASAVSGFTAGPAQILDYLTVGGQQAEHLLHLRAAFAGMGSWLPRQLPLALIAGAAEAAVASWLRWLHTDEWNLPPSRPGLIVAARRVFVAWFVRTGGGAATREGGCLGIKPGSGARITLSWPEASRGVLVCGAAGQDVLATSFQLIHAALRRRKPVVVLDFSSESIRARLAAACLGAGVPLQVFGGGERPDGGQPSVYEPFRYGDPGQRAALVAAMLTWDGPGSQHRRGCLAYLTDVFELLDAVPGDPRVPVLDEVIHLLDPAAMRAKAARVPPGYPRRDVLVERAEVSASLVSAEPGTVAGLSRQLRGFRSSPAGRWLGQPVGGQLRGIELDAIVSGREAALFCLGGSAQAAGPQALAMLSRLVCQDLLRLAASLRAAGEDGDGVIWLAGCQAIPERTFAELVAAASAAGLAVLATTTSAAAASVLAEHANALVVHRMSDPVAARELAAAVAPRRPAPVAQMSGPAATWPAATGGEPAAVTADDLLCLGDGEFVLAVRSPRRLVPHAHAVRARILLPRSGRPASARAAAPVPVPVPPLPSRCSCPCPCPCAATPVRARSRAAAPAPPLPRRRPRAAVTVRPSYRDRGEEDAR